MNAQSLILLILQFYIPGLFSMLFRIFGLGAKSKKHAIAGLAVYSAVSLLVPAVLIPLMGYDSYNHISFLVMQLANLSVFLISSDSFLKTVFLHFTQANAVFWISTVVGSIRRCYDLSYLSSDLMRLVLCAVALYLGLRYCAKPLRFMADTIRSGWLGLIAIPSLIILSVVMVAVYFGVQPSYPEMLMIVAVTLIELSFGFYVHGLYRSLVESRRLAQEQNRLALLQAEIQSYDAAIAAARQSRHDLRHHNAVVLEYLRQGDTAQAMEYLSQSDEHLADTSLRQYCENITANAILRLYDRRARTAGICFEVQGDIPQALPLDAPQLSALLSNLLENAAEACEKQGDAPYISLTAQQSENGFQLEVRNSCPHAVPFENGFPKTTKPSGGLGTKSVAAIVDRGGGLLRFRQEGGAIIAQIFLPMQA